MKLRILALLMALVMATGLAACGGGKDASDSAPAEDGSPAATDGETPEADGTATGGDLSVTVASSPETIDPAMNSSVDGFTYLCHLNESLYRYKWDGTGVELGLAESADVSEDGLTWTFTLRDDALWSDGQPVTAEDFVYSWKRAVDPDTAAPYAGDMGQYIKNGTAILENGVSPDELGVEAVDEKTLKVELSGPCAYFDEIAAFPFWMPVRKDMIEAHGDEWVRTPETYIAAGPFKMESFTMDEKLVVVPNENYYDRDKLVPTSITFQFLADDVASLNALQSGDVSYTKIYPPEEKETLAAEGLNGMSPQLGTYYVSFNTEQEPFNDPNVRKAFSLALDRDFIANVLRQGDFLPADAIVGPGFNDAEPGTDFREKGKEYIGDDYEANKEAARAALAEAGYPDGEGFPVVEYLYNDTTLHQSVGEAMQNMWKEVLNVQVDMDKQEWNVFQDSRRKGNFTIARNGWIADYNDPVAMLTIFITGGGNNDGKYSNPEFDAQMQIALTSADRAERMEAMHRAEDILLEEDYGCIPVMYYAELYAVDPNLKGWANSPLGAQYFHTAYYDAAS